MYMTTLATIEKCKSDTGGTIESRVSGLENLFIHETVAVFTLGVNV